MGRKKADFIVCDYRHASATLQAWSANHPNRSIISTNTTIGRGPHIDSAFFTIIYEEMKDDGELTFQELLKDM